MLSATSPHHSDGRTICWKQREEVQKDGMQVWYRMRTKYVWKNIPTFDDKRHGVRWLDCEGVVLRFAATLLPEGPKTSLKVRRLFEEYNL